MNPNAELIYKSVPLEDITIDAEFELRGSQKEVKKNSGQWLSFKESIKANGILQPLLARAPRNEDGTLDLDHPILVDGRQRESIVRELHAEGVPGFDHIPVAINPTIETPQDIITAQIDCNIERISQNSSQVANHLLRVVDIYPNITVTELADMFHKTVAWASQILKLKNLTPTVKAAMDNQDVSVTACRSLAELPEEQQDEWLTKFIENPDDTADIALNLKEFIKESKKGGKKTATDNIPKPRSAANVREIWEELQKTPDHPLYAGYQHIVQLDPESMALKRADKETKELERQVAKDERALKKQKEIEERLANQKKELEARKAKIMAEAQEI
jgi:hypothetical protein